MQAYMAPQLDDPSLLGHPDTAIIAPPPSVEVGGGAPPVYSAPGTVDSQPAREWITGLEGFAPAPPSGSDRPPASRLRWPRRRRWVAALLVALLLVMLGVGAGVGIANGKAAPTSTRTIVIGASSAPNITLSSSTTSLQQSVETVAAAVKPSVVEITSSAGGQEAIGSGDILTADGYIVTNDHVVQGFSSYTVTLSNGTNYSAQLVGQDPQDDLAVLKIAATKLKPIAFADSSKAQVGDFAIVVGNPLGLQQSVTFGIVSALNRSASEAPSGPASELTGLVQTSAPINPGNSGGALVNLQGQLIGIPTLEATNPETGTAANGIGYAIPANRVENIASQLIQNGKVTSSGQGFLGIQAQDVTPQLAAADSLSVQSGVVVTGFAQDSAGQSPAQQAGLQVGDVITAVDGQAITSNADLSSALLSRAPGARVTLTVVRGTAQHTITITLGERPANS
jgi:S1-C subfamily serine protease